MTAYLAKQEEKEVNQRITADIRKYGEEIIDSDIFQKSFCQKHHTNMTVGEHTLNVTACSLRMCYGLEKAGVGLDKRAVTVGALCHDLGIIGRHEKFSSTYACWKLHPIDSVKVAKSLLPHIDSKTENIIRRHMWPLCMEMPNSAEGYVIVAADKYSSIRELLYRPGFPLLDHETEGMIVNAMLSSATV